MIQNIVGLRNKDAKDVMVHRKNVVTLDGKMTIKETIEFINENSFSINILKIKIKTLYSIGFSTSRRRK